MNYEQKYKDALERAKKWHNAPNADKIPTLSTRIIEEIFPELRESEDERIRQGLITSVSSILKGHVLYGTDISREEALTWLEKQGEQKSIWHNEDEEPQRDSLILLIMQSGTPIVAKVVEPNHTFTHGERWAYIDDLFERQGENTLIEEIKRRKELLISEKEKETSLNTKLSLGGRIAMLEELLVFANEKQGEQNLAGKVEPKFKVDDWCIDIEDGIIFQIVKVLDNTYTYRTNEGKEYSCTHYSLENDARLWTIQDAKPGDVLYSLDSFVPFIYKGRKTYEQASTYCGINIYGKFYVEGTKDCIICCEHYRPASSEQRSLLFSKMREAGYEWDAEKKELKKIEPKPTDEEMKELLRTEYEKGRADAIAETQVAWSEEDDIMKQNCHQMLALLRPNSSDLIKETIDNCHHWLKDLKQRNV